MKRPASLIALLVALGCASAVWINADKARELAADRATCTEYAMGILGYPPNPGLFGSDTAYQMAYQEWRHRRDLLERACMSDLGWEEQDERHTD